MWSVFHCFKTQDYVHFSVVAYSVALGLIMSVGRQVTGKLPTGKVGDNTSWASCSNYVIVKTSTCYTPRKTKF